MFRRYVAPILRLLLALGILALPLVLAAIAQAAEPPSGLVTLRAVVLSDTPSVRTGRGLRLPASFPVTLLESKGSWSRVEAATESQIVTGWEESSAFLLLNDPSLDATRLLEKVRFQLAQRERPVLTAALLSEVLRRDPANVEAWRLLGATGESLANQGDASRTLAQKWGVRFVPRGDGKGVRYDGEAYRRLIALSPAPEVAEEARVRLLTQCGAVLNADAAEDLAAAAQREKDLGELLASFPSSARRLPFLLERAKLLSRLTEAAYRLGDLDAAESRRAAAIEAASEVSSTAPDAARRRSADRLVARLTKSFPRRVESEKPVVATNGSRASFKKRGGRTFLEVVRPDGKDLIQPYEVTGADPTSLAFDPSGSRLVWDESPAPGWRRTRLIDLGRARVVEPAALAEPELLTATPGKDSGPADRYTTFVGFSPDGHALLVVLEGFTGDGVRIPRRHFLCDAEGKRPPVLVERPFSAPGTVDWDRITAQLPKLSG